MPSILHEYTLSWYGIIKTHRLKLISIIRPGKLYERSRSCLITVNRRGIRLKDYEVATRKDERKFAWLPLADIGGLVKPVNVRAGSAGGAIFVCRGRLGNNGEYHPGKAVNGDIETCLVGYGHKERSLQTVELLACPLVDVFPTLPPCDPLTDPNCIWVG